MAEFHMLYHIPSGDALHQIDTNLAGSTTLNVKTTCRKSFPANLLQVSYLVFDPGSRLSWVIVLKRPFFLPYCYSLGFKLCFVVRLPAFLQNTSLR